MPEPAPGEVYWSANAQRFYQVGRRGALSGLEALQYVFAQEYPSGIRFYVNFEGSLQRVPNPENFLSQEDLNKLTVGNQTIRSTTLDWENVGPGDNAFYRAIFTYVDENGKTQLGYRNFRVGATVDREVMVARMIKTVGDLLEIDRNSEQGGSDRMLALITSSFMVQVTG